MNDRLQPPFDDIASVICPEYEDHAEAQMETQRHRELNLKEALDECHAKGVSKDSMQTLLFETGARWKPKEI